VIKGGSFLCADSAYICKTIWTDGKINNSSCEPSPSPRPSPSASPSTTPTGPARVISIRAPANVNCDGRKKTTVNVSFTVARADSWKMLLDGSATGLSGTPPTSPWSNTVGIRMTCGLGANHTVQVVAANKQGIAQRKVTVELSE
jgi:hypothetical protein